MSVPEVPKGPKLPSFRMPELPSFKLPEFELPQIHLPERGEDFYESLREFLQDWRTQVPEGETMSVTCSIADGDPIEVLRFGRSGEFMFAEGVDGDGRRAAILTHYERLQFAVRNIKITPDQEERPRIGFLP